MILRIFEQLKDIIWYDNNHCVIKLNYLFIDSGQIYSICDYKMYKLQDIPRIGLGTYKLKTQSEINHSLEHALKAGYRMIDTAILYKNENLIAHFLNEVLPKLEIDISRNDLWITTKVPYFTMLEGNESKIRHCIENSVKLFGGYVDLFLIHASNPNDLLTWQMLREYQSKGQVRNIGISNYNSERLENFITRIGTDEVPWIYMNQIEYNPFLNRGDLVKRCHNLGIRVTAYGSLYKYNEYILEVGKKYNVSAESILLVWTITNGITVIPMSRNGVHIRENIESLKINLEDEEIRNMNNFHENYTRFVKHL